MMFTMANFIILAVVLLGCTPLHWAVLRGHVEACSILVHAGTKQELTVKDKAGFTPIQLAYDKGHRRVALLLVRNNRDKMDSGLIYRSNTFVSLLLFSSPPLSLLSIIIF